MGQITEIVDGISNRELKETQTSKEKEVEIIECISNRELKDYVLEGGWAPGGVCISNRELKAPVFPARLWPFFLVPSISNRELKGSGRKAARPETRPCLGHLK